MKLVIVIIIILVIAGATAYLLIRDNEDNTESNIQNSKQILSYKNVSPVELDGFLASSEDIFLLDVHIPEQEHIIGTDSFIPYNELEANDSKLPSDKNQKIVVYCRSGSMSKIASDKLIELGYTDVSNLEGGIQAWNILNN